jgi:hypothetical protein
MEDDLILFFEERLPQFFLKMEDDLKKKLKVKKIIILKMEDNFKNNYATQNR